MEFLSLIKYTFSFKFSHSWAQLRAFSWILLHPHIIVKRRWVTWKLRKIKDGELIKKMHTYPIVWQYFFKQLKTYSQVRESKF